MMKDQESTRTHKGCITCSEGEDDRPLLLSVQECAVTRGHGLCSTYGTCLNYGLQQWFVSIRVALFRKWPMEVQNYDDYQVHILLEKTKASLSVCVHNTTHTDTQAMLRKNPDL